MFERVTDEEERGQVGIGTLIVFIAMVLVAAIAAGVLINTAGLLQSQAVATGEESTAQVSNVVQVDSATGQVTEDPGETYEDLDLTITNDNGEWASEEDGTIDDADILLTVTDNEGNYLDGDDGAGGTVTLDGSDSADLDAYNGLHEDSHLTGEVTIEAEVDATEVGTDDDDINDDATIELRLNSDIEDDNTDIEVQIVPDGEDNMQVNLELADEDSDALADGVHDDVRQASIMVSLGPGADAVDLGAATFEFVGDQTVRGQASELDDLWIEDLEGDDVDNEVLEGDRNLQVYIDLAADNDGFNTIEAGDSAEFRITTADGAQTVEVLMAPSTLTDDAISL